MKRHNISNSITEYIINNFESITNDNVYMIYNKWSAISGNIIHDFDESQWVLNLIKQLKQCDLNFMKQSLNIDKVSVN